MNILYWIIGIILLAIVEQLISWIMEKIIPVDSKYRHPVALVLALTVVVGFAALLQSCTNSGSPTPTPQPGLLYNLTIQDSESLEGIEGAEVLLTVPGVSPFRAISDVSGLAVIEGLPDNVLGKTAVLTITAAGYEPYRLNVAVNLNQLPDLIPLTKRE